MSTLEFAKLVDQTTRDEMKKLLLIRVEKETKSSRDERNKSLDYF